MGNKSINLSLFVVQKIFLPDKFYSGGFGFFFRVKNFRCETFPHVIVCMARPDALFKTPQQFHIKIEITHSLDR
jgi:hypothetical protein